MARILLTVKSASIIEGSPWLTDDLIAALDRRGHSVDVLVFDRKGTAERSVKRVGSILYFIFPMVGSPIRSPLSLAEWAIRWIVAWVAAQRELRDRRYDLVVNFSVASHFWGFSRWLKYRSRASRTLLILWDFFPIHHFEIGRLKGRFWRQLLYWLEHMEIRSYDDVAVMSLENARFFSQYHPDVQTNVIQIPVWGADDHVYPARSTAAREPGLTVVFGGQLAPGRGLEQLLRTAAWCLNSLPDLRFLLVGSGSLRGWCATEISRSRLENVSLLEPMPRSEYLTFLVNHADIGLVITVGEVSVPTFPSKVIDLMRCEIPVLACVEPAGDFGRFVEDVVGCGVSAEAGNDESLRRALTLLASLNEKQRKVMGERGRQYFKKHMTADRAAERIEEHSLSAADSERGSIVGNG